MTKIKIILSVSVILLGHLLIPAISGAAQSTINTSKALSTIISQAEQTYLTPFGGKMQDAFDNDPGTVATILGLTMHRQYVYMQEKPEYIDYFDALRAEVLTFLDNLATAHDNINPKDGTYFDGQSMAEPFYNAMMGEVNDWVIRTKKINPAQVDQPFILTQVVPPAGTPEPESLAKYNTKKKADSGIELLGLEVAGAQQISGKECPEPADYSKMNSTIKLDTNNNPNDNNYIECCYGGGLNPNEYITSQTPYVNNVIHGVKITYKFEGKYGKKYISSVTPYVNGKRHGVYQQYALNDAGQRYLLAETPFENGLENGIQRVWGKIRSDRIYLKEKTPYKNGKMNGVAEYYNEWEGIHYKMSETTYLDGKKHGRYVSFWDASGKVKETRMYNNGIEVGR